jgi:hypothetical protein
MFALVTYRSNSRTSIDVSKKWDDRQSSTQLYDVT